MHTAAAETRRKNEERSERQKWVDWAANIMVVLVVKADFWSLCFICS